MTAVNITTEQLIELYIELNIRTFIFMTIIYKVCSVCHCSVSFWAFGRTFPEPLDMASQKRLANLSRSACRLQDGLLLGMFHPGS